MVILGLGSGQIRFHFWEGGLKFDERKGFRGGGSGGGGLYHTLFFVREILIFFWFPILLKCLMNLNRLI